MAIRMKLALAAAALWCVARPMPAAAQLYLANPDFRPGPIEGNDPLVGLPLPGASPQEYAAHLIWNLRAGLNVAALQCQFSPFLRVVPNYNGILAHHSKELLNAYQTVGNYFKRIHGPKRGQTKFDDYSTITYNNFSTLYAQYGFCQVAGDIAKEGLAQPKGQFYLTARARVRELRNSLVPAVYQLRLGYNPYAIGVGRLPPLDDSCWDGSNHLRNRCKTAAYG